MMYSFEREIPDFPESSRITFDTAVVPNIPRSTLPSRLVREGELCDPLIVCVILLSSSPRVNRPVVW